MSNLFTSRPTYIRRCYIDFSVDQERSHLFYFFFDRRFFLSPIIGDDQIMNMNSHFLFIGTNSQVLESYRRDLADYFGAESIQVAPSDAEITSFESLSALFIDVEQLSELNNHSSLLKKWNELSKTSPKSSMEVPIIVIFRPNESGDEAEGEAGIVTLDPRFCVLKKPLQPGELLHAAKNVIIHQHIVSQAIQSERLAGIRMVLRGISHELGNIVLRVAGKADLAMMIDDVASIHRQVEGIVEASRKASTLVKNLQSFAKAKPHLSQGKISKAIDEALKRLDMDVMNVMNVSSVQKQKILIQKKQTFKKTEPDFQFDLTSMTQAFFNLFENSILAMPEGGLLTIEISDSVAPSPAAKKTQGLSIRIQDSGVGMTPDILKRAFDFAHSSRKEQASGLGLPIARELIRSHGGTLDLKSDPGHGTEISIWLPA
jgi:signal transduction histidine kinase